jgi:hypothetical protein
MNQEKVTQLEREFAEASKVLDAQTKARHEVLATQGKDAAKRLLDLNVEIELAFARVRRLTAELETAREEKASAEQRAALARFDAKAKQCTATVTLERVKPLVRRALKIREDVLKLEADRAALVAELDGALAEARALGDEVDYTVDDPNFEALTRIAIKVAIAESGQPENVEETLAFPGPGEVAGLAARLVTDPGARALFDESGLEALTKRDSEKERREREAEQRAQAKREAAGKLQKARFDLQQFCEGISQNPLNYAHGGWRSAISEFAAKRPELGRDDVTTALEEVGAWFEEWERRASSPRRLRLWRDVRKEQREAKLEAAGSSETGPEGA